MEVRQLEIFHALAEELHFTRAAARVHCVQSNVTTQVRALEEELGTPLFRPPCQARDSHRCGQTVLAVCRESAFGIRRGAGRNDAEFDARRSRCASVRRSRY